jgi:hypothetical protein
MSTSPTRKVVSLKTTGQWLVLLVGLALLSLSLLNDRFSERNLQTSYWIWAGITAKDAPPDSELYLYQGLIFTKDMNNSYKRVGLYPHPLKAKKIFLVYRLEGDLPKVFYVMNVFKNTVEGWKHHPVTITGIQIDFDSATSKLLLYSDFLAELRSSLPSQYALSITGLGDWAVNGNETVLQKITTTTDEVVFQLYQDRSPLKNINFYIESLSDYPFPFRVGFLAKNPNKDYIEKLEKNPKFRGVIYFIQK